MSVRDTYKKRRTDRSTYSFHLERSSMAGVDLLVKAGVYENKSHVVDEAIRKLLRDHGIAPVTANESAAAAL